MKRFLPVIFLVMMVASMPRLAAQDSAAAVAERQEAEERYRRLTAANEALQTSTDSLRKKLSDLTEEVRRLRDQAAKPQPKYASIEDLTRLADKIKELDEKRQADKELILSKIEAIVKTVKETPVTAVKPISAPKPPPAHPRGDSEKGYEYVVQKGDGTLTAIIAAYNEEFKKQGKKPITLKQVLEANPGLNPNRMRIGQKLFIPIPE